MTNLIFSPIPRDLSYQTGSFALSSHKGYISIPSNSVLHEAQVIRDILSKHGQASEIALSLACQEAPIVEISADSSIAKQGYLLEISPEGIKISYADNAGLYYAAMTLQQILDQAAPNLPCLNIVDYPDFLNRGFMLDVSRDRVPNMPSLLRLIDELASVKINQLQLYMEHTFAYPQHREVWENASAFTSEEILFLDEYCQERHIELVPNQNSLGHMERWLKFDKYRHLSETPDGFMGPDERWRSPSTLNPLDPASFELIEGLYDTLLPHFSSKTFNVGCDEPWELGRGKSKEAVEAQGGRVYLNWLLKLHESVTKRGRKMMFWGDIITHYPDLIPELPKDILVMEWGYESTHPFDENCKRYADSGIPFYVCPGTSSWNAIVGRVDNARNNLKFSAQAGLKHGAEGYLITDWGDNGHWQAPAASYAGIVYGAAVSWAYDANETLDIADALSSNIYHDKRNNFGKITTAIANIYKQIPPEHINGQLMAYALQVSKEQFEHLMSRMENWGREAANIQPDNLRATISSLKSLRTELEDSVLARDDAQVLIEEWRQGVDLLSHGAKWLLVLQGQTDYPLKDLQSELDSIVVKQRELWLARSRRGGLEDSIARFNLLKEEYRKLAQS